MAQVAPSTEAPETPPPIPSRSHLRNDSTFQLKLYAINSNRGNMAGTPSSAASQALLEGIDCQPADTQQRLHGPASQTMDNNRGPELREGFKSSNVESQKKGSYSCGEDSGSRQLCSNGAGVDTGSPDDLQQPLHLTPLIPRLVVSCEHDQKGLEDHSRIDGEAVDVSEYTATRSGRCNTATSTVTRAGLGLTTHSLQSSQYQRKTTDTKVSDWFTHGLLDSSSPEADSLTRNSRSSERSNASRHVPLSLFPPKSSSADVREYLPRNGSSIHSLCPVSPLNNGRDVYGNHIPSNARDYLTAHSQSSLLNPLTMINEKAPVSGKLLTTGQRYDCRWDRFKSFWKTAGTQASNQRANLRYPHIILDTDNIPRDVPEVMYPGRAGDRGLHSIRSPFPVAYSRLDSPGNNVKGNYSIPDLRRERVRDSNLILGGPELVDAGGNPRSKDRFNVTYDHKNTSRDETTWHKVNSPLPKRRMRAEINPNDVPIYSMNGRPINLVRDGSSDTCRKVEQEQQMPIIEKDRELHSELACNTDRQLTCQQQAQKQDQRIVCEDANTAAITPLHAKGPFKLDRMLDFGIQLPRKPTSSSRNLPRQDSVPVSAQDSKKRKQNIVAHGHAAMVPAMPSTIEKPQPLFRTMLSKAGNIPRSVFAASFNSEPGAFSQRQPSTDSSKISPPKGSMSADRNEYPHSNPLTTHGEANTLAGHYQVLTAGAFDDPPSSHHNRHASLASVTNEALLIADQLLQRDVRWSTDQMHSSFSSDSTTEIMPLTEENKKDKKENRKKGEVAKAMAWMGLYV